MPKQRYMQNLRPVFVSLVSKAANRREFLTRKAADGADVETVQVPILKSEDIDGVRYITGVAYEPGVVDTQGDQMTAAEIAKAAHLYMRDYRGVDIQHSFKPADGCWVAESTVLKADTEIGGAKVPAGAWVMTVGIEDPAVVAKVDSGELNGFSIGGFAQYVLKADISAAEEEAPGWFRRFLAMIGFSAKKPAEEEARPEPEKKEPPLERSEPPDTKSDDAGQDKKEGERTVKKSEFEQIMAGLGDALIAKGVMVDDAPAAPEAAEPVKKADDAARAQDSAADIAAVIKQAVAEGFAEVAKACGGASGSSNDEDEKKVKKGAEPEPPAALTKDDLVDVIKSAVTEQIAPMQQTVNTIAKAYNAGPRNLNGTSQPVEKSAEPHYMDGFFSA